MSSDSATPTGKSTPLRIGLTGGIGSGKTRVTDQLAELGVAIIDTDVIAHSLTRPGGPAIGPIRALFGEEVIDGTGGLDRAVMRELVFKRPKARRQLEALLHPMIGSDALLQAARAQGVYQVFVVPLLVESGRWRARVDRVCVIDCDVPTQINRVQQRSRLPLDQIHQILDAQATREQRLEAADDVIVNDGDTTPEQLRRRVDDMHRAWLRIIEQRGNRDGQTA